MIDRLIADRSIQFDGKHIGTIRYSNLSDRWLATIPENETSTPDYECSTYDKAVAMLLRWHAMTLEAGA